MPLVTGNDINAVVSLIRSLTDDGDVQLSLAVYVLVVGCRSCGVDPEDVVEEFRRCVKEDIKLIPVEDFRPTGMN